ncbi:MAG: quinone oxidoreductase [Alphaproteobacteria bacterium]|nr:quinone oxidoreductase [Alphaproteobacteria bacterium]
MPQVVRIHKHGGPEVLKLEEVKLANPKAGEVRLRQTAIGLNFIDTYHRSGLYPMKMPVTLGTEAAGIVEAVGKGVTTVKEGDRVAYAGVAGAYAEARTIAADRLVKLPRWISDQQAAAMMLKGMTAEYLIRRTYRARKGETVVFHAAAGGVGLIACQWLKQLGVTVIGTVGSDAKAKLAKRHGCRYPVLYKKQNLAKRVREITKGAGVPVVYDSVGASTFAQSLDCLAPRGMLVSFGNSSGPVPPFEPGILAAKGSLYFTRPSLAAYTASREDLVKSAQSLFRAVKNGVKIRVDQTFKLKDIVRAHKALEGRRTTGSTVIIP